MRLIAILLMMFLLICTTAFASDKPVCDGALGYKWGDGQAEIAGIAESQNWKLDKTVKIDLSNTSGQAPDELKEHKPTLALYYLAYLAHEQTRIALYLDEKNLHSITIFLPSDSSTERFVKFQTLYNELTIKYGKPDKQIGLPDGEYQQAYWYLPTTDNKKTEIALMNVRTGFTLSYSLYRPLYKDL